MRYITVNVEGKMTIGYQLSINVIGGGSRSNGADGADQRPLNDSLFEPLFVMYLLY